MSVLRKVKTAFLAESFLARFLKTLIVPLGLALLSGQVIAAIAEARWIAPGWPYFHGYAKNVEVLAITGGLLAGAASLLLSRKTTIYLLLLPVGIIGVGVTVYRYQGPYVVIASSVGFPLLMAALLLAFWNEKPSQTEDKPKTSPWRTHALCITLLVISTFFFSQRHYKVIDTFHMGQKLIAALDLLNGGIPFETLYHPHGLHNSGLTALWVAVTGKVGTSPLALSYATQAAVGAVALYLLSFRVLASVPVAFGATATAALLGLTTPIEQQNLIWALHYWFFIILGFFILTSGIRFRTLLAGVVLGLGHIWRVDLAVFGFIAIIGLLAYMDFVAYPKGRSTFRAKLITFLGNGASVAAGAGTILLLSYVALGWPNLSWYKIVFRTLPLYHIEASGLPFPTVNAIDPKAKAELTAVAYRTLVFTLILVLLALNVALGYRSRSGQVKPGSKAPRGRKNAEVLVFIGLLAACSLRTILGRSDIPHITFLNPFLVVGSLFLIAALARARFKWSALTTTAVVALMVVFINARKIEAGLPQLDSPWDRTAAAWRNFREHVSENPPAGQCDDQMYTPWEVRLPGVRALIEATCEVEQQLSKSGIKMLLTDHSAPWYYVRFGSLPPPTRYSYMAWAYTPNQQWEFIEDLRRSKTQALLKVRNFKAQQSNSGVPNGITIPIVEAYLQERRKGVKPIRTGIGDLYIYDNPKYGLDPPPDEPFSPVPMPQAAKHINFVVDSLVSAPSGFLTGHGWAVERGSDWARSHPVDRLFLFSGANLVGELNYGLPRPDVARHLHNKSLVPVGFTLDLFVPPSDIDGRGLGVRALLSDGRVVDFMLDTSKLRRLPKLTGQEWDHLPTAVLEAKRLARDFRP